MICFTIHERRETSDESVFLDIKRLGGEGKLDLFSLKPLHNLKVDPLVGLVIQPIIRGAPAGKD